jgi:hypothetical protein
MKSGAEGERSTSIDLKACGGENRGQGGRQGVHHGVVEMI